MNLFSNYCLICVVIIYESSKKLFEMTYDFQLQYKYKYVKNNIILRTYINFFLYFSIWNPYMLYFPYTNEYSTYFNFQLILNKNY